MNTIEKVIKDSRSNIKDNTLNKLPIFIKFLKRYLIMILIQIILINSVK